MTGSDDTDEMLDFFEHFVSTEFFVALTGEPTDDRVSPQTFETSEGTFALAFSDEEALTDFIGACEFAALPGRVIASLMAAADIGLCLDPGQDPRLLAPQSLEWVTQVLAQRTVETIAIPGQIGPPRELTDRLLSGLERRILEAPGLANRAVIASSDGRPLIGVLGAEDNAQGALAGALQEGLAFAGAGADWSIAFLSGDSAIARELCSVGITIDFPQPEVRARQQPVPPGSDPESPPKLR